MIFDDLKQATKRSRFGKWFLALLLCSFFVGAFLLFPSSAAKPVGPTLSELITQLAAKELWYDQDITGRKARITARSEQMAQLAVENDSDELTNQEVRQSRDAVRSCKYNLMEARNPPCDALPLLQSPSQSPSSQPTASPSK